MMPGPSGATVQSTTTIESTRPTLDKGLIGDIVEKYYGLLISEANELKSHEDRNFHISAVASDKREAEYNLKILQCEDVNSHRPELDVAVAVMTKLKLEYFTVPIPICGINGEIVQKHILTTDQGVRVKVLCCLLTFLPGEVLFHQTPLKGFILHELGLLLCETQVSLKDFTLPGLVESSKESEWNLENIGSLSEYVKYLDLEKKKTIILEIIKTFQAEVLPKSHTLPSGVVHGDFHDENILYLAGLIDAADGTDSAKKHPSDIKSKYGIIDYLDVKISAYVFDLATSLSFFMICANVEDFIGYCAPFLAGYNSSRRLSDTELDVLYYSVCACYARELVLCEYHYTVQSERNDYLLTSSKTGWKQLEKLWSTDKHSVMESWNTSVTNKH